MITQLISLCLIKLHWVRFIYIVICTSMKNINFWITVSFSLFDIVLQNIFRYQQYSCFHNESVVDGVCHEITISFFIILTPITNASRCTRLLFLLSQFASSVFYVLLYEFLLLRTLYHVQCSFFSVSDKLLSDFSTTLLVLIFMGVSIWHPTLANKKLLFQDCLYNTFLTVPVPFR